MRTKNNCAGLLLKSPFGEETDAESLSMKVIHEAFGYNVSEKRIVLIL